MLIHNAVLTGSLVLPTLLPLTGSLTMTGSIGINVPNPSVYGGVGLAVSGAAANSIARVAMVALGSSNGLNIGDDGTDAVIGPLNSATKTHILSRSGGVYARALTVTSDGNVGVGTTSPITRMQLQEVGGPSVTPTITLCQDGDLGLDWVAGTINFYSNDSSSNSKGGIGNIRVAAEAAYNTGTTPSYMAFYTHPNVANNNTTFGAASERMRITSGGNVLLGIDKVIGINTTDGSDNGYLALCGASGDGEARGGHIYLSGNERAADAGTVVIAAGNVSNGAINFRTGAGTERMRITNGGIVYAVNGGVDGTYQAMIGGMYNGNNNETNLILSAVSSVAAQSGFRFDVSNGGGSTGRTTSMTVNRSSVSIVGSLSKGSGTFKIDHPLESKKDTHHLVHSFIEGPRVDLIYRGKVTLVNGTAAVNIDETVGMTEGTFATLNRDVQCFTTNETGWDAVKGKVEGNILTITSQNTESTDEISWMVIGERQDEHIKGTEWTDADGKPILEPLKPVVPPSTEEDNSTEENNSTEE